MNREELLAAFAEPIPVGPAGFIRLVDAMGDDAAVCQAARISYGKGTKTVSEDRGLIRYLMRAKHTSPFEQCEFKIHVQCPMDVWRQWIRHRMACLAGDTSLQFDLPGGIQRCGSQLYTLTVAEVFERFQPSENISRPERQGYEFVKRDRVQAMHLRCVHDETGEVQHTRIVDVWQTGIKQTYTVSLSTGETVTMSANHLCFTDRGWLRLRDIVVLPTPETSWDRGDEPTPRVCTVGPGKNTGVVPHPNLIDEETEEWRGVLGWESFYEVSSQGRVRRIVGGRGSRSYGRCKKVTISNGRAVVSLNRPGEQATRLVHQLMLEAFTGEPRPEGLECCHNDGNSLNNTIENLRWGTTQSNADDRVRDAATTRLTSRYSEIVSVTLAAVQMTYDIEVEGPFHNFSANGMIVHNSVNEYSTRYSEAIDEVAVTDPGAWRLQSGSNKQGSGGMLTEWPEGVPGMSELQNYTADDMRPVWNAPGEYLSDMEAELHSLARTTYEERLRFGVAREQARKDLPLSTYTAAYWKIDLHNLLHFLQLRLDPHAQLEIRQFAEAIARVVESWVPWTWEAFVDYRLEAVTFSRQEMLVLRKIAAAWQENERECLYAEHGRDVPERTIWRDEFLEHAPDLTQRERKAFLSALGRLEGLDDAE